MVALDARIVLHDSKIPDKELPRAAIRPYPYNYVCSTILKNGVVVTLRPIRPEDIPLMENFHQELSERSVYQQYFSFVSLDQRIARERLTRICFNDYDREWAIMAEIEPHKIIGIGRLSRIPGTDFARLKMTIVDAYHHLGLGNELMSRLLFIARNEKIGAIDAYILSENEGMIALCAKFGFEFLKGGDPQLVHARWTNS